ncbi:unnamed protein product [Linum trigynum]|uniref:HalX domain-containing protein n=1 Tax=Linum trigynum TaxID=586398 RepID=A0AAV2CCW8_9ROSI
MSEIEILAHELVVEVLKEQIKELSTDKEHIESTLNRVTMDLSLGSKEELRLSELFHQLKADIDKEKLHLSEQVEKLKGVLNDEIAQGRAHAEASSMSLSSKFSKLQDSACKKISKLETMIRKSMEEKLLTEAALESMRNEYAMTDSEEYRQLLDRCEELENKYKEAIGSLMKSSKEKKSLQERVSKLEEDLSRAGQPK